MSVEGYKCTRRHFQMATFLLQEMSSSVHGFRFITSNVQDKASDGVVTLEHLASLPYVLAL